MRGAGPEGGLVGEALDIAVAAAEEFVGPVLHPAGDVRVRRAAVGGIVFEPAVRGRVVGGRDDDAVGEAGLAGLVEGQDGVRDGGRGGEAVVALDEGFDAVGREDFEGRALGGGGGGVGVFADEQRSGDILGPAIFADGLGGGENVGLGERAVEGRAAMAAGAEADQLVGIRHIRLEFVVIPFQFADIHQQVGGGDFSGEFMQAHRGWVGWN